ncbi:sensor histidine kinase [Pedobacter sp.]|uniref:sensor histidine kinase n=1 Tax=Pedobacter sp. TaxID=1411316 RepID=UPI003D7FE109
MDRKLKILHLEDLGSDADLVKRVLIKGNFDFQILVVENQPGFIKALNEFQPDVILADHSLPSFDSHRALEILKMTSLKIPFILVSGSMSEEFAVDIIKRGADDYILKDRLERLPTALNNVLEKFRLSRDYEVKIKEIIHNEKHFRALLENSGDAIASISKNGKWLYQSPAIKRLTGFSTKDLTGKKILDFIHPDDVRRYLKSSKEHPSKPGIPIYYQFRLLHKHGGYLSTEGTITNLIHEESVKAYILNFHDCTERNSGDLERAKMHDDILERNKELEQFSYIISHNLRSPVANMMGLAEEINSGELQQKELKEASAYLMQCAKQLDHVILDLNNVLQAKQGVNQNKERVSITSIIEEITSSISTLIKAENVCFSLDVHPSDELITIKSYIYSIFFNLISNSIKYRQQLLAPHIEISFKKVDEVTTIVYKDNGLGMDLKKYGTDLFGLYKRFHHHVEGKGMGLFMVKTQMNTLDAKISCKSEIDKGTLFVLTFKENNTN